MKVVVAIDSLKGSLTSMEAGNAIKEGILKADKNAEVIVKPLADGGEGTTEALTEGMGGEMVSAEVMGPLGQTVKAEYGYLPEKRMAIMEMAAASGIILVPDEDRDPMRATSYGVGEMILDAIQRGCRSFIIGIGGSATNDGGIGMLSALGYDFLDEKGNPVALGAKGLSQVACIKADNVKEELKNCSFQIACDVTNPLCGSNGATYIYGPQKGVKEEMKERLDGAMAHYAAAVIAFTGKDCREFEGAGAAGGLGFAFLSFLNTQLQPGIDLVLDAVQLEASMEGADYVVTGEGRLDSQTAMGKGPVGVARLAKRKGAGVIALAGSIAPGAEQCNEAGIDAYFPILTQIVTLQEAMKKETARMNMQKTAEQVFRLVRIK